jgi:hypothetical protein
LEINKWIKPRDFHNNFNAKAFEKNVLKCIAQQKIVTTNMQLNFIRNGDEIELDPLCHLLFAGTFVHCANLLVKLTLSVNLVKLFPYAK